MGFSGAIQLGLLFLLARLLPTREFGIVALLMVSIPLISRFVTLGSDIGLGIRIWKRTRLEQQADLNSMLTWTAAVISVFLLLIVFAAAIADFEFDSVFLGCALLVAAFRTVTDIFQMMLRREARLGRVGIVIITRSVVFGGACVAALLIIGNTAFAYLAGVLVAEGIMAFWALGCLHRLYGLRPFAQGSYGRMRALVRVGFPSIPGTAAVLLLAAGDRFVIATLLGLTAAGIYALGQRLAESIVQILFVPFATAFGPYALNLAHENQGQAFALVGRTALSFAFIGGIILGIPVVAGREIILTFAGPDFAPAAAVFLVVIAAVLVYQISQILMVYFNHTEQLQKYMWIVIVAAAANIVLNIFAVWMIGIIGAAVVSLVVYEAMVIVGVRLARQAGVVLVALGRLHLPLLMFGVYLGLIYKADSLGLASASAIGVKALLWIVYVIIALLVSAELRGLIADVGQKIRVFIAS